MKMVIGRAVVLAGVLSCACVCATDSTGNSTGAGAAAKGSYPNFMIPVWKQTMFDRANNLTEAGIKEFLEAASAGLNYRLVAYQGCRIIGLLSNLEREKYGNELRDRLARHGALETVTRAMGAHLVSPRVLAMGCIAIQAMADGHREHTETVIALGGGEVVSWVLLHQGTTDPKLAEYCTAAVASLSYTPVGAQRLGAAGVIDGLSASMSAFLESSVDLQIYGCAAFERLARNPVNRALIQDGKTGVLAIMNAVKKYREHPSILTICGKLLGLGPDNALPPGA